MLKIITRGRKNILRPDFESLDLTFFENQHELKKFHILGYFCNQNGIDANAKFENLIFTVLVTKTPKNVKFFQFMLIFEKSQV